MLGFHPERGGYVAQADPTERRLVRGLACRRRHDAWSFRHRYLRAAARTPRSRDRRREGPE